jgi:hypothetical protein
MMGNLPFTLGLLGMKFFTTSMRNPIISKLAVFRFFLKMVNLLFNPKRKVEANSTANRLKKLPKPSE